MKQYYNSKPNGFHWITIVRILVGLLFIFSGLIKANDPDGLTYKMQEFFELWGMHGLNPFAKTFSITIITFEILAGFCMLIGYAYNVMAFLIMLLMIFFTFLTGYAVWYEASTGNKLACGCFGDCIPLKAIQSFWKDIILLVLVGLLLVYRKEIRTAFSSKVASGLLLIVSIITIGIQWYAIKFLPFVDCLPYKVGANMIVDTKPPVDGVPDVYETTHIYKNKLSNELVKFPEEEFLAKKIWEDTLTWAYDTSITILVKEGNMIPKMVGYNLTYFDGEDATEFILNQEKPVFLWYVRDVETASIENIDRIKNLVNLCVQNDMFFFMLTSNTQEQTDAFLIKHGLEIYTATIDPTTSKTAIRTNPGLVLLEKGIIKGKWSYKQYPKSFVIKDNKIELKK
jgi:uncharacterized membrane protein YphA (DoxX/SURF4 family)